MSFDDHDRCRRCGFGDGVAVATDEHAGRWRCVARRGGEVVAVASGYAAEGEALRALAERLMDDGNGG